MNNGQTVQLLCVKTVDVNDTILVPEAVKISFAIN